MAGLALVKKITEQADRISTLESELAEARKAVHAEQNRTLELSSFLARIGQAFLLNDPVAASRVVVEWASLAKEQENG